MKHLCLLAALVFGASVFAADSSVSTSTASTGISFSDFEKNNLTEGGFYFSSVDGGAMFADLTLAHDIGDWFTGGVRALLPVSYTRDTQIYGGQAFGRFPILNSNNVIYFEAGAQLAGVTGATEGTMLGLTGTYAIRHHFTKELTAGADLGLDYFGQRLTNNQVVNQGTLATHFAVVGGYYF